MQQNNGIFLCKNFARKIHHFFCSFTLVLLLCLTPAHSAGYTCSTTKTYTSCNSGYYLSNGTCGTCPAQYGESDCDRNSISDCFTRTEPLITCKPAGAYSGTGWDYYNNSDSGQSCQGCLYTVSKCKSGYYLSNNTCTQCPSDFPITDPEAAAYSDETTLNDCWRYCNASDVPNSTARTGWKEYGGDNTCAATACAAGYYLSNKQCLICPKGYYCNNSNRYACPSDFPLTDPRYENYSNETSINDCWRDCNASDVPNSTARTGWKEYSGNNTCTATACAAGHALSSGTCVSCPSGYTSSSGMTNGTAYCYKTCPAKTGYTLTGGVDYYSATDTCTYSANCNAITINPFCTGMTSSTIYKKTDTAGWFSDSTCTTITTKITPLPTCRDIWEFRGYYSENISDLVADGNTGTQYITKSGTSTTAGTNWTVNTPATIYAAWAHTCNNISNGTCTLNISDTGQVDYTTTCNTGFSIDASNTYNPTCTVNTYSCNATQYLNGTTCQNCENGYYCSGGTWTYNGGIQGRNKCPSNYPLTDPQTATYSIETSINGCWRNCDTSDLPNAATYTGWKEYSGNNTCKILTCANGYGLTTTNECAQMCTAGITYIHIAPNIKIPLYASQRTTPSIHVMANDTICYANLATDADSGLNIKHNNITYHATN